MKSQVAGGGPSCASIIVPCDHGQPVMVLMRCQGPCDKCGAVVLCPEPHPQAAPAEPAVDPRLGQAIADIPAALVHELVVLVRHPAAAERVIEVLATSGGKGITPAVLAELRGRIEDWPPR
jgi:hypothetical protein